MQSSSLNCPWAPRCSALPSLTPCRSVHSSLAISSRVTLDAVSQTMLRNLGSLVSSIFTLTNPVQPGTCVLYHLYNWLNLHSSSAVFPLCLFFACSIGAFTAIVYLVFSSFMGQTTPKRSIVCNSVWRRRCSVVLVISHSHPPCVIFSSYFELVVFVRFSFGIKLVRTALMACTEWRLFLIYRCESMYTVSVPFWSELSVFLSIYLPIALRGLR